MTINQYRPISVSVYGVSGYQAEFCFRTTPQVLGHTLRTELTTNASEKQLGPQQYTLNASK